MKRTRVRRAWARRFNQTNDPLDSVKNNVDDERDPRFLWTPRTAQQYEDRYEKSYQNYVRAKKGIYRFI